MAINPGTARFAAVSVKPAAPPVGYCILYFKADNILYIQDDAGVETPVGVANGITSLTGEATATGPGAAVVTLSNSAVIGKVLTGFSAGPNSAVLATDTLLQAIQKLQAQVSAVAGTTLAGDVSGPFNATVVDEVGGKNAAEVATSVDDTQGATGLNIASTIVKRDASGDFAAHDVSVHDLTASGDVTGANLSGTNTGDVSVTDSPDIDLTLTGQNLTADLTDTPVAPDTYGAADRVAQFTVDQKGRVIGAADVPIAIPSTQVTNFNEAAQDAVGAILTDTNTIDLTYDDVLNQIKADVKFGDSTIDANVSGIRVAPLSLTNSQIALGAAIARDKLASGSANRLVVNDASGVMSDAAAITAARALISDANGIPTHSITTATELSYVNGVTGPLQGQLNAITSSIITNEFYVDKSGNDTTGTGSMLKPFLTVQRAATAVGTASSSADYDDLTKRFWTIKIMNGVYTENVTIGTRLVVVFDFNQAQLVGNVTVNFDKGIAAGATTRQPKYVFKDSDLRPSFTGSNIPISGINGNLNWVYINGGSSVTCQVHLIHTGVSGNITTSLGSGGTNNGVFQVYGSEAFITGQVQIGTGSGSVFLDSMGDDTVGLGGITGVCRLQMLRNVRFSGVVSVTGSQTGSQWYNVSFFTGSSTTGSSGSISVDANSFQSYFTNVTSKGTETFTFLDNARAVAYNPTTPSDWAVTPATVMAGLDSAASRLATVKATVDAATDANTPSTIVRRDASGNFSAGTISANLTGNVTGSASNNVLKAGDTMSGVLNMGGNKIASLATPTNPNDAVNKDYVDLLAVGIIPQVGVLDPDVINDGLSTPPGSPVTSTTYLIGPSPTGAWAAIGAGRLTYWDGAAWRDGLGRSVMVGDRLGIGFEHTGVFGGNFVGQAKKIATITNATPGSYAYTFETPIYRWTTWINNLFSDSSGSTYYFNNTNWVQIASGFTADPGDAISIVGSLINVKYDNVGIGLNGSNQLRLLSHASTHLPSGSDPLATAAPSTSLDASTANGVGSANSLARSDHSHDILTGTVASQIPDQVNAEGSGANLARADHTHNIPSGSVVQIGTSNFNGAAASFSLSDHVHSHGNQTNGALHAIVTTLVNGFMSAVDKIKLDAATALNTFSTLVFRDSAGKFEATEITSNLVGNVTGNVSGSAGSFTGNLAGDVTGPQGTTVVAQVGGKTAAQVSTSVDDTLAATSANTPSTIVKRSPAGLTELITQQLNGSTSGNVQLKAADTTTSYAVKMPAAQGAPGTYLNNDGVGNLTWTSPQVNIDGGRSDSVFVIGANIVGGTP